MRSTGLISLFLLSACASDVQVNEVFNLERPSAVAFGCWGDLRITAGAAPNVDQPVVSSAMPVHLCQAFADLPLEDDRTPKLDADGNRIPDDIPPGQEVLINENGEPIREIEVDGTRRTVVAPSSWTFVSFILQPTSGSVAVAIQSATEPLTPGIFDADTYTPGRNAIPIGTNPVDLAVSSDGCYLLSANAGSCDLSALDITTALESQEQTRVDRITLTNSTGEVLEARASDIVTEPPTPDIGFTCPTQPQGLAYVAYPDCNWVAAIDVATGEAVAGIQFGDGTVEITDGSVSCPAQCGLGASPASRVTIGGPGRPSKLHLDEAGTRLFIGAENLPAVTWVELDADHLPVTVQQVALEGEVGVLNLAATEVIPLGGDACSATTAAAGQGQFVYAVTTDSTVRVVETLNRQVECDTQVDPRYLADTRDVSFLTCMPVGDVMTPPRRSSARSPGIHFPRLVGSSNEAGLLDITDFEGVPIDVAFASVDTGENDSTGDPLCTDGKYCPQQMVGEVALVTTADGGAFVVNVDDKCYPDFERADQPLEVAMPLALAHQVRDAANDRTLLAFTSDTGDSRPTCANPGTNTSLVGGPRAAGGVIRGFDESRMAGSKVFHQPTVRAQLCDAIDEDGEVAFTNLASDLAFTAPVEDREAAFPDLMSTRNELVRMTWEGLVSDDAGGVSLDGPRVRAGAIEVGADLRLTDPSRPFCRAGVEPHDILELEGCDPTRGDAQCSLGSTCFVHPDTPTSLLGSGICIPEDRVEELADTCRDFAITTRRYTIVETNVGDVRAVPRRRALDQTPIDGCVSDDECQDLYRVSVDLASADHPVTIRNATCDEDMQLLDCPDGYVCQGTECVLENDYQFACAEDPSRRPGKAWCQMTCATSDDCQDGYSCDADGFCVAGQMPPAECASGLQRYRLRVGESFAIVGEYSGFLHNRVVDDAGACVEDPTPDPLKIGRVPLTAPPCEGDGPGDLTPNPCSLTVEHSDIVPDVRFNESAGTCDVVDGNDAGKFATRQVPAIRIQQPGARFNVANISTRGDANCIGDLNGSSAPFPAVHPGSSFRFDILAGFVPLGLNLLGSVYPARIAPSPDGTLWVLDQGDAFDQFGRIIRRGQVVRLNPAAAVDFFSPATISLGQ